jgi:myo-inositol-1(or 4)-monophosphatase
MEKRVELLKKIVRDAGQMIHKLQLSEVVKTKKHVVDLVTRGDLESERFLIGMLKKNFPKDKILSEETYDDKGIGETDEYLWVADPIDGTTNYSRGRSYYSVSVGLTKKKRVFAGAIYSPVLKEFYFAEKGKGAFLNKIKIRCSAVSEIGKASLATETHWKMLRGNLEILSRLKEHRRLYITGCASLSICEVASGRTDLYMHTGLRPWDNAAAFLIAKEAGAKITDLKGREIDFYSPEAVIANPVLHANFLSEIGE